MTLGYQQPRIPTSPHPCPVRKLAQLRGRQHSSFLPGALRSCSFSASSLPAADTSESVAPGSMLDSRQTSGRQLEELRSRLARPCHPPSS